MIGNAASAAMDDTFTIAPSDATSLWRKVWITASVPSTLTSRCCSTAVRSVRSSYPAMPALLMTTSRSSTSSAADPAADGR